ncbi:MAG: hypothetical protein RL009_156 [Actinomycetota bacterium]
MTRSSNFFRLSKSSRRSGQILAAFFVLAGLLAGSFELASASAEPRDAAHSPVIVERTRAATALAKLAVKGRAPKTGYARELFSDGWGDIGSCDLRNFILARDLVDVKWRAGEACMVETGVLKDPYTTKVINFKRGVGTSIKVQIDHVVAVSDAWQKGAQQWNYSKRNKFYNDPLNLLAVDGPTNSSKGDGDAATWLPPNKAYRCAYVARQIAVKTKYQVWVTSAEKSAMANILNTCPGYYLPTK